MKLTTKILVAVVSVILIAGAAVYYVYFFDGIGGTSEILNLNGVGDYSEWDRTSTCEEPSRYQCLDESFEESDADNAGIYTFIYSHSGEWVIDWFTIETPSSSSASDFTIYAKLTHFTYGEQHNDKIKLGIMLNGIEYWGDEVHVNEDSMIVEETWNVNPQTGSQFTKSEIESIQIGISGLCETVYPLYCEAMYVTIN